MEMSARSGQNGLLSYNNSRYNAAQEKQQFYQLNDVIHERADEEQSSYKTQYSDSAMARERRRP